MAIPSNRPLCLEPAQADDEAREKESNNAANTNPRFLFFIFYLLITVFRLLDTTF
jgi:hypothetical protein